MTVTFDPTLTFESLTAAFDKAEKACERTVVDIVLDLEIADLFDALADRGIAVLIANQRAWRESVEASGVDPRFGWGFPVWVAEIALTDFFTDRDARDGASAVLKGGA